MVDKVKKVSKKVGENAIKHFSEPYRFSFKDGLAIAVSLPYIAMILMKNFLGIGDIESISLLKTPFEIVLSGYFIHEVTRMGVRAYTTRYYSGYSPTSYPQEEYYGRDDYNGPPI